MELSGLTQVLLILLALGVWAVWKLFLCDEAVTAKRVQKDLHNTVVEVRERIKDYEENGWPTPPGIARIEKEERSKSNRAIANQALADVMGQAATAAQAKAQDAQK